MVSKHAIKTESGLSMLELLVCMGIVILLCGAAMPKNYNMDKMYVKSEVLHLMNTIRYAQTWSYSYDYCTYDNYYIQSLQRPNIWFLPEGYCLRVGPARKYTHHPEHGVTITSNAEKIKFNIRGHSTACTIRIRKGLYEERIIIDTVGRVRVE